MNPLFQQANNNNLFARLQQFRNTFTGNPQAQIQQMLNIGRITQEQYNQAYQMAQQLQKMIRG